MRGFDLWVGRDLCDLLLDLCRLYVHEMHSSLRSEMVNYFKTKAIQGKRIAAETKSERFLCAVTYQLVISNYVRHYFGLMFYPRVMRQFSIAYRRQNACLCHAE